MKALPKRGKRATTQDSTSVRTGAGSGVDRGASEERTAHSPPTEEWRREPAGRRESGPPWTRCRRSLKGKLAPARFSLACGREELYNGTADIKQYAPAELDEERIFSYDQKLAIFRKYDGVCQVCAEKLEFGDSYIHYHHIDPYITGGETEVENGLLVCRDCHLSKIHGSGEA